MTIDEVTAYFMATLELRERYTEEFVSAFAIPKINNRRNSHAHHIL